MAENRESTHPNAAAFPKGVSGPALRALASAGVHSISDLTAWTEEDVADLHGMGPKALGLLKSELQRRGMRFRST